MDVIVVRGASGVVAWVKVATAAKQFAWRCSRDSFQIAAPGTLAQTEAFLVALAQHSQQLVGAIAQVVQLEL